MGKGVKGYGIGEAIIVPCLDLKKPVEIWAGYGKSSSIYQSNSRQSKIRITIVQAELYGPTQYGTVYKNLKIIEENVVKLKDINNYQNLSIPEYEKETYFSEQYGSEVEYNYFLGIQIIEVYKGAKWDDTCISEIRNSGD